MADFEHSQKVFATIDDDALADISAGLGEPVRIAPWNTSAAFDNVRHFANGIGDWNPLWVDKDYGRQSVHHVNLAPPTFLNSLDGPVFTGAPGLASFRVGSDWNFYDWVRVDDQLCAEAWMESAEIAQRRHGDRGIKTISLTKYYRLRESGRELVAEHRAHGWRIPPRGADDALNIKPRAIYHYTDEELADIEHAVLEIKRRGEETRWWDDVAVGDDIGQVVKGPYTRMSMLCWYAGAPGSPGYVAHDLWWRYRWLAEHDPQSLPSNGMPPEYFLGSGVTSLGHHNADVAIQVGMPGVYDNGNQRVAMVAHLLTNWMGDEGFISKLSVGVRRPVIEGDTVWIRGKVDGSAGIIGANRRALGPTGQVSVSIEGTNQLGQTVVEGSAAIELSRR